MTDLFTVFILSYKNNFPSNYRTVFLIKAHFRSGYIISKQIP